MRFVVLGHWIDGDGRTASFTFEHHYAARLRVKVYRENGERLDPKIAHPSPTSVTVSFDTPPAVGEYIYVQIGGAMPLHCLSSA
jgi:hypothetical protein